MSYSASSNTQHRKESDKLLAQRAETLYKTKDTPVGEKISAFLVSKAMKIKTQLGLGVSKKKKKSKNGKKAKKPTKAFQELFKNIKKNVKKSSKKSPKDVFEYVIEQKKVKPQSPINVPRELPLPQYGTGLLSTIFAVAAALGIGSNALNLYNKVRDAIKQKKTPGNKVHLGLGGLFLKRQKGGKFVLVTNKKKKT